MTGKVGEDQGVRRTGGSSVFDGENGVAKRRAIDADYKTNRPVETPEPIKALGHVKRGLDICGIDWIELDDEEADDVIATLVTHYDAQRVVIMSGDKDYYQLLGERIRILNTARKAGQRLIGPKEIPARLEIETRLHEGLSLTEADHINTTVEDRVHAAVPTAAHVHAHAHADLGLGRILR